MFMIFVVILILMGEGGLSVNLNFLLVAHFVMAVAWKWGSDL